MLTRGVEASAACTDCSAFGADGAEGCELGCGTGCCFPFTILLLGTLAVGK